MTPLPCKSLAHLILLIAFAVPALALGQVGAQAMRLGNQLAGGTEACTVGNVNTGLWDVNNYIQPPQSLSYVFDPTNGCTTCAVGFQVQEAQLQLVAATACSVQVRASIHDLAKPGEAGYKAECNPPGFEICTSNVVSMNLMGTGIELISIPLDCGCFGVDRPYAISFEIISSSCAPQPALRADFDTGTCKTWKSTDGTYQDVRTGDAPLPTNLVISATAACCSPTVGVEAASWGTVKQLYIHE